MASNIWTLYFHRKLRYVVAALGFLLLAVNGCDAVIYRTEGSQQRLIAQGKQELRVLTLSHPLIYHKNSRGHLSGIDYDLLQAFAKDFNFKLKFIVYKDSAELIKALADNKGDLIAARMRGEDIAMKGFIAGPAYEETSLKLFCHDRVIVNQISDLSNLRVALLETDSRPLMEARLKILAPQVDLQKIVNSSARQILKLTSKKQFDCAFAEDLEGSYFARAHLNLVKINPETGSYVLNWILRPELQDLQTLMQAWFQKASRQDDIMRILDRYFTYLTSLTAKDVKRFTSRIHSVLPEYEDSFKAAASHYRLDWKLLAAIAFQESHWEASAVSYTGVRGIMQLTMGTARLAGVEDRENPHQSIWGGAFYFRYLLDRLPSHLHPKEKLSLALAAYNVGYGHLMDAQKLVLQQGRNPFSWHDIKSVLPHLSNPAFLGQLDYGAARGYEALEFVDRVKGYYSLWASLDKS